MPDYSLPYFEVPRILLMLGVGGKQTCIGDAVEAVKEINYYYYCHRYYYYYFYFYFCYDFLHYI